MDDHNYVVVSDAFGGLPEVEVQAADFEDAAAEAMETWESGATFVGIDLPQGEALLLLVTNKDTMKSAHVQVTIDYEPVYTAEILELLDG